MSNYFSVGVESRIGLGFDRHRTHSVIGNKCVYCWEGFKKMFLKTPRINSILESFNIMKKKDNKDQEVMHKNGLYKPKLKLKLF